MIEFKKECPTCEGSGVLNAARFLIALAGIPGGHVVTGPCPDCVGGRLPDDETVHAGAEAMFHAGGHYSGMTQAFVDDFRVGLVAAARYQKRTHET